MGCDVCNNVSDDFKVDGLDEMLIQLSTDLVTIEAKYPDSELLKKKEEILKNRHEELLKTDLKDESKVESVVKKFNNEELKIDNDLIKNKLDKMHEQYEAGLKVCQQVKNKLIEKLEKKLESANSLAKTALNTQIEKVKSYSPAQFLDSEFGKPIKDTLEKQGLSESALKTYKDDLRNQRAERRKKEREEFGIKQNEWPEEEMYEDDKENFYQKMLKEYEDKMELK